VTVLVCNVLAAGLCRQHLGLELLQLHLPLVADALRRLPIGDAPESHIGFLTRKPSEE
jgi:hypothetical protein